MRHGLALACAVAGCALVLGGCGSLGGMAEPPNAGFLQSYEGLQLGGHFHKVAADAEEDVAGFTRVRISSVEISREAGMPWHQASTEGEQHLFRVAVDLRRALSAELATRFEVLHDDSLVDDRTLLVRLILTRITVVPKAGSGVGQDEDVLVGRAGAGMELAVWRGALPRSFMRVKDWRSGRQPVAGWDRAPGTTRGDLLTIFRSWGERLTKLLVDVTRQRAAEGAAQDGSR